MIKLFKWILILALIAGAGTAIWTGFALWTGLQVPPEEFIAALKTCWDN